MAVSSVVAATATTDFAVDVPALISSPLKALLPILRLLPGWETVEERCVTVEQLSGAMTNMVYRCGRQKADGSVGEEQAVLMRVHASSTDLFDRAAELEAAQAVAASGLGPRLLLLFGNGRVEEFLVHHVTLAAADIHEPVVSQAIAGTLARFHSKLSAAMSQSSHPQHQAGVQVWRQMRAWLTMVQQLTPAAELQLLGMSNLQHEVQQLQEVLTATHLCWVAMCHNDAQYGNIMASAPADHAAADHAYEPTTASADAIDAGDAAAVAGQLQQLSLSNVPGLCQRRAPSVGSACSNVDEVSCVSVAGSSPSFSGLSGIMPASSAAVAGSADAAAGSSGGGSERQVVRHSSGRVVQLRDGSIVLPGMKSRPRGQSPERSKRPAAAAAAAAAGTGTATPPVTPAAALGAAAGGAAGLTSSISLASLTTAEQQVGSPEVALKPPSAAAVMRHSSSQGELLLPALVSDNAAATSSAAPGGVRKKKAARISFPGSDVPGDDKSVEDSEDADDLLLPVLMEGQQRATGGGTAAGTGGQAAAPAGAGRSSSTGGSRVPRSAAARASVGGTSELVADAAAAASRSARLFRQLRKKRQTPAAGIEFPTFQGSDQESDAGSGDDFGLPDGYDDDSDGCSVDGSSSSSLGDSDAGSDDGGTAAAAAAVCQRQQQLQTGATSRKQPPGSGPKGLSSAAAAAVARAAACSSDGGGSSRRPLGVTCPIAAAAAADAVEGLTLIDYEYSGFNPIAYDIANHWCEWAADYHSDMPALLDFGRLPTEQQQWDFVQAYLASLLASLGVTVPGVTAPAAAGGSVSAAAAAGGAAAAVPGDAAVGVSSRSEMWSTLSSRGASMASLPDTDVAFDAHSLCSVGLSTHSRHSSEEDECAVDPAAAAGDLGGSSKLPGVAAAAAGKGSPGLTGEAELRNVWTWLCRYQQQQQGLGKAAGGSSGGSSSSAGAFSGMDGFAFERLCGSLVEAARAYMCASHLFWALWGLIQARVSEVDWDFAGYAAQRWRQYKASRPAGLQPLEAQEAYNE